MKLGRVAGGRDRFDRAFAIISKAHGLTHPLLVTVLSEEAEVLIEVGHFAHAQQAARRGLALARTNRSMEAEQKKLRALLAKAQLRQQG